MEKSIKHEMRMVRTMLNYHLCFQCSVHGYAVRFGVCFQGEIESKDIYFVLFILFKNKMHTFYQSKFSIIFFSTPTVLITLNEEMLRKEKVALVAHKVARLKLENSPSFNVAQHVFE